MSLFKSAHGGNTREAAALAGVTPEQLLDFSANINPLGMPDALKCAIVNSLSHAERYPDVDYLRLHQALAAHHGIPAEWILAANGETEAIFTLACGLKPRRAMIVTPGFAEYRRALRWGECEIEAFPLREADGWQLTDAILPALTPALDCLFLCTPNNPTGLLPERELLLAIARRCGALGIALIVDEAFLDFIPDEPGLIPMLQAYPHVWVLRSLTKFYAIPGLRLGYLVNSDPRAVAAIKARQMPWSINAFAALAGEMILEERDYQQATWRWLAEEGARFYQRLSGLAGLTVYPGRANYLLLRCEKRGQELQQALLAQRILIRSCANYPGLDARYYRVAIRSRAENERLLAALGAALSGTAPAD
ncbi:threonine-phosphate decarboxylase CobD [Intestinirhabdus alba]|uniref:threonine-phosphate decarboxylase n=1 Tax=Intestinirhabdus alba TaxID=2899544 RepID=A0A6L6IG47_9ENTR|nr:threonine-phosphate decarboxylase CobD [Intestinirhabdus alba]MTH44894.1 threonine-phosphate decarboxylase [Intestinirhabdus alba]